jgi:hypothetical protein
MSNVAFFPTIHGIFGKTSVLVLYEIDPSIRLSKHLLNVADKIVPEFGYYLTSSNQLTADLTRFYLIKSTVLLWKRLTAVLDIPG